jgi:uncharacterized membrane protein YphA (DoxX/SURF4 family)
VAPRVARLPTPYWAFSQNLQGITSYTQSRMTDAGLAPYVKMAADAAKVEPFKVVEFVVGVCVFLKVAGSLALLFGGDACGSVMLLLFLAIATPVMHAPTYIGEGAGARNHGEVISILKNVAIGGGILVLWASQGGRYEGRNTPGKATSVPKPHTD